MGLQPEIAVRHAAAVETNNIAKIEHSESVPAAARQNLFRRPRLRACETLSRPPRPAQQVLPLSCFFTQCWGGYPRRNRHPRCLFDFFSYRDEDKNLLVSKI